MLDYFHPPAEPAFATAQYAPHILGRSGFSADPVPGAMIQLLADRYARELLDTSAILSSQADMEALPSYRRLVSLGSASAPALLRLLQAQDFAVAFLPLLEQVTGDDPVRDSSWGIPRAMRDDWLAWGVSKGLI